MLNINWLLCDDAYDDLTVRDILAVRGVKNWGGCKKVGKFIVMIG